MQIIVLAAIAWAILALLFFLLFSVTLPGQGRPEWYRITTYVLEEVAFLAAGLLCLRNWRSSQIVSGRAVWLSIGLGMLSYFIGNLLFAYWELGLGQEPDVSPGDFFFILTYLLVGWGMLLAIISRRLNLTLLQWLAVVGVAVAGSGIAYALAVYAPSEEAASGVDATAASAPSIAVPDWAAMIESQLSPLSGIVQLLYVIGDILLLMMAMALLLAFWGGRFSVSWRCIAASAFCFYIADLWFSYAISFIPNYETGALPEVFWIFSGVLVAVGAALEFDVSTRSRRGTRRKN
jgi:hypothetical protein